MVGWSGLREVVAMSDLAADLHEGRHVVAEADRAVIVVLTVVAARALCIAVAARSWRAIVVAAGAA